jgi:hypothetical protein
MAPNSRDAALGFQACDRDRLDFYQCRHFTEVVKQLADEGNDKGDIKGLIDDDDVVEEGTIDVVVTRSLLI